MSRQLEFTLGVNPVPHQESYGGYIATHDPSTATAAITHVSDPGQVIDTIPVHKGMVKQALAYWHKSVAR